jgi:antitoxin VapB
MSSASAKLFRHGGSQAVRLPKAFRFEGTEVAIERRGEEVVLKPRSKASRGTLADLSRHLKNTYPKGRGFPTPARPRTRQKRDLDW